MATSTGRQASLLQISGQLARLDGPLRVNCGPELRSSWRAGLGHVGRYALAALGHSMLNRISCESRSVMNVQFINDLLTVFLHGFNANRQRVGNLLIGHAFGDKTQDLGFARR